MERARGGVAGDCGKRLAIKLCRIERKLITLAGQSLLPGTRRIEPRPLAIGAGELQIDIRRHAGLQRARLIAVRGDQAIDRGFDERRLIRDEEAIGRCRWGRWRLGAGGQRGGGADRAGATEQIATRDGAHSAAPFGGAADAPICWQRSRAVTSWMSSQASCAGRGTTSGGGRLRPFSSL